MSDESERPEENVLISNTTFLTVVWCISLVVFLCSPICCNRRRRTLWWRRFKFRRWDVYVEPERDPEWYRIALERYNAYRERAEELERLAAAQDQELPKEEEDEMRKIFLLGQMSGYTIVSKTKKEKEKGKRRKEKGLGLQWFLTSCQVLMR